MGNVAGAIGKTVTKKARRFNIEARTDKFLEKNVKVIAPKPMATQKEIEKITKENPNLLDELSKPNPELIDRLKNVYVSSFDKITMESKATQNPDKPLPVSRKYEPEEFGYVEPGSVPPGQLSLRQAIRLISLYHTDKETNNLEKLALEFNLATEAVGHIVENFKLFTVYESKQHSSFDANPLPTVQPDNTIAYYERVKTEVHQIEEKSKEEIKEMQEKGPNPQDKK